MASISGSRPNGGEVNFSDFEDDESSGDKVCTKLNLLRKKGQLCDVTLISNGKSFPALKAVLVLFSAYFKIPVVVKECCSLMKSGLVLENCFSVWRYIRRLTSLDHNPKEFKYLSGLQTFTKKFILKNFRVIWKQKSFLHLSSDELVEIISNNTLEVATEEEVLRAVVVSIQNKNRPECAEKVLPHVRLALLDRYIFDDSIRPIRHYLNSARCQRLLNKAIDYQSLTLKRMQPQSPLSRSRFYHSTISTICVYFNSTLSKQQLHVFLTEDGKVLRNDLWTPFPKTHYIQPINNYLLAWDVEKLSLIKYDPDFRHRQDGVTPRTPQGKTQHYWNEFGQLKTPRENIGLGELDGNFYAIGGSHLNTRQPCNIIEKCNPKTKVWSVVGSLPVGVNSPFVTPLGGYLYIAGGNSGPGLPAPLTSVLRYCPRWNKSETFVELPTKHICVDMRTLNGKLYAR